MIDGRKIAELAYSKMPPGDIFQATIQRWPLYTLASQLIKQSLFLGQTQVPHYGQLCLNASTEAFLMFVNRLRNESAVVCGVREKVGQRKMIKHESKKIEGKVQTIHAIVYYGADTL